MTTSALMNAGILAALLLFVGGLICVGFAIHEAAKTRAARRRRAEARAARDAAAAEAKPDPVLPVEERAALRLDDHVVAERFEDFMAHNPLLSSRLTQLWAGIEPDKEQAS